MAVAHESEDATRAPEQRRGPEGDKGWAGVELMDDADQDQHRQDHLAALMRKLDARNRVEIAIWAHETGRTNT